MLLTALLVLGRGLRPRLLIPLLVLAIGLQAYEFGPYYETKRVEKLTAVQALPEVDHAFWDNVAADDDFAHVVFAEDFHRYDPSRAHALSVWAVQNDLTLNDYYLARKPREEIREYREERVQTPEVSDVLIIAPGSSLLDARIEDAYYYLVDDLIVRTAKPVEHAEGYLLEAP